MMGHDLPGTLGKLQRWSWRQSGNWRRDRDQYALGTYERGWREGYLYAMSRLRAKLDNEAQSNGD